MASNFSVIIDTGPLIAILREEDEFHRWASSVASKFPIPFVTSESVISESCFLLQRDHAPIEKMFALLQGGIIQVEFDLQVECPHISALMAKYDKLPKGDRMSLADASLVRLAELHDQTPILTLDKHFNIYRKNGRQKIPLIAPWIYVDN